MADRDNDQGWNRKRKQRTLDTLNENDDTARPQYCKNNTWRTAIGWPQGRWSPSANQGEERRHRRRRRYISNARR